MALSPNSQSIEQYPVIVETRPRVGDWEADAIIGKNHRHAIVSLVERKTGFTLIHKVEYKTVQVSVIRLLTPYREQLTLLPPTTVGNLPPTKQSAKHCMQVKFYFAHSYASWQRGTNENTNGLIRQYFLQKRDFTTITQQEIDTAMERLNNRPRKRLGSQVFFKSGVVLHS